MYALKYNSDFITIMQKLFLPVQGVKVEGGLKSDLIKIEDEIKNCKFFDVNNAHFRIFNFLNCTLLIDNPSKFLTLMTILEQYISKNKELKIIKI